MRDALQRLLDSKKFLLAMIPVLVNLVAVLGWDAKPFENQMLLLVDGAFAMLLGIQGVLDTRHGSPSDGTVVEE